MCTNKANLQVALLRANGIPAAYGEYLISREALRPLCRPDFFEKINEATTHIYCAVWLGGRWVKADATVDSLLLRTAYRGVPGWRELAWDGEQDAIIDRRFVLEERGLHANVDEALEVEPRFLNEEMLAGANAHLESLILARGGEKRWPRT